MAESGMSLADQLAEGAVIRAVDRLDPAQRLGEGDRPAVDLVALAHDPRDGTEPARDPDRSYIGITRQLLSEHPRIELVRLAVHIEISTGVARLEQRCADARR